MAIALLGFHPVATLAMAVDGLMGVPVMLTIVHLTRRGRPGYGSNVALR